MGKKNRGGGKSNKPHAKPKGIKSGKPGASSSAPAAFKAKRNAKAPEKKTFGKPGGKFANMANPKMRGNKTAGRQKRRANPELSDDDSLPSDSEDDAFASDDDEGAPKTKKQKTEVNSDSDIDEYLNEDEEGDGGKKKKSKKLLVEESSDEEELMEEDDEKDGIKGGKVRVTARLVKELESALKDKPTPSDFKVLVRLLSAAVSQASGVQNKNQPYVVEGSLVFNAIILTCLKCVGPALQKFFKFGKTAHPKEKIAQMKKNKNWKILHVAIRTYLTGLTELLTRLQQEAIVRRVLKHVKDLLPFYSCNPKASKGLFKHLIQLWGTGSEKQRLDAFMTLFGFLQLNPSEWVLLAIKKMYVAYVSNSRVTSSATWPAIGFMASSLVEVLSLKPDITYQQAFIYIRQMAIHVRNATNQKNKETQAKVYNWPFMHCIYLWSKLVGNMSTNQVLAPLAHPLIQVILSTIKVNPVRKYYPMMFHCVRALNIISGKTDMFIPTLPLLLTALQARDLNKKPKTTSFKPFDFMGLLKFSESQLLESSYRTGIADQIQELFIEYVRTQCWRIGYPELIIIPTIQMKTFLKESQVTEISRKFRSLLAVMEDHSRHMKELRKNVTFKFADSTAVATWEKQNRDDDSPFMKFYKSWKESRKKSVDNVQTALDGAKSANPSSWKKNDNMEVEEDEEEDEAVEDIWLDMEQSSKNMKDKADGALDEEVDDTGDIVKPMEDFSDNESGSDSD